MRSILAIAAGLLLCANVSAAPIDSGASAVYLGIDRACRVVLSRYEGNWVQADIRCLHFGGWQSASLTTVYAPGTCPQGIAYSLTPWAPGEYLSLRSYDSVEKTLQIVRGTDQTAVTGGIGIAETWYRIGFAPSLAPYSCGAPPQRIDQNAMARYCREHPTVPACR